jgi:hypothetical protein
MNILGVGKSYLIDCIYMAINNLYKNFEGIKVALLAPTGIAANNIDGNTIHKFFKMVVNHTNSEIYNFYKLNKSARKYFQQLYSNLIVIIIGNRFVIYN